MGWVDFDQLGGGGGGSLIWAIFVDVRRGGLNWVDNLGNGTTTKEKGI